MTNHSDTGRDAQLSRDPDTIRQWADEHDAVPVREPGAGEEQRYRMVPQGQVSEDHERAEWDAFFEDLESSEDVVIYHGADTDEPFQVTGHRDVTEHADDEELAERLLGGETVTTDVTEKRVVESVVVEELTLESELVGSEVLEDRVVDVQLLDLECVRCDLEQVDGADARDWFDTERYLEGVGDVGTAATAEATTTGTDATTTETDTTTTGAGETTAAGDAGEGEGVTGRGSTESGTRTIDDATGSIDADAEFLYRGDLEVEETWAITREYVEEHTVESEIGGKTVSEAETIQDYDVDVSDLHREIVDQGVFESGRPGDDELTQYDAESEMEDDDRITTTFTRERRVEDEIVDRKRLDAEMTGGQYLGMDLLQSRDLDAAGETAGADTTAGAAETATGTTGPGTTESGAAETTGTTETTTGAVEFSEELVGNTVLNAAGDEIGMVSDVEGDANQLYVDPDPGITERVTTALGWGDHDQKDYPLGVEEIRRTTDDEVWLKGAEEIEETRGDHV